MIELGYLIVFATIAVTLFFGWHAKTQELINETRLNNDLSKIQVKQTKVIVLEKIRVRLLEDIDFEYSRDVPDNDSINTSIIKCGNLLCKINRLNQELRND